MPKPRILCLHGAASNNDASSSHAAALGLSERAECVYLRAPHATRKRHPGRDDLSEGPCYAWADASKSLLEQEEQWDESLQYLAKFCKAKGPFDGVYGFGQGAAMVTNFSHPSVWEDRFQMKQPPWRFALLACGASNNHMTLKKGAPIDMGSFHIVGKRDRQLNNSKMMARYWCMQKVICTHGGGHEIDAQFHEKEPEIIDKLNEFLDGQLGGTGFVDSVRNAIAKVVGEQQFYLFGMTFGGRRSGS